MSYDGAEFPTGFDEKKLALAFWDTEASQWVSLDSVIDYEAKTVTATVSHFTAFTIMAYTSAPPSAVSAVTDPAVSPATAEIGEVPAEAPLLPPAPQSEPISWLVLWGIGGGVVLIILIALIIRLRRRAY